MSLTSIGLLFTDLSNAKFYSKSEIQELDNQGKLSDITKKVLTDNNWL